ncbi:MAG TPA: site-specific integrase [Propionibacteriaceae bacterium]|jgi:integrase
MASIQKRPDGRWRARYRDEAGKEHARHFPRKVDGQRWLDEVTASVVTGRYVDPGAGRVTFAAYFEEWSARQVWESSTLRSVRVSVASVTFANLQLAAVKRSHVEQWVKTMSAAGLAASTIHTRFLNVHSVFRGAFRDKLIAVDPAENITLPRRRRAEHAMRIPTSEQVGELLATASAELRLFIALCAFAGLRLGEASAVQVDDVDFLRRSLNVRRQVQHVSRGPIEVRPPKFGSERTVFLPDALLEMLAGHVKTTPTTDEGWLFTGESGRPIHPSTITDRWRAAGRSSGVEGFKVHDLRHYFASGLIAAGCDVVTVQRALGHSNATTTLNTYSHLWPKAEDRTRGAAEAMIRDAFGYGGHHEGDGSRARLATSRPDGLAASRRAVSSLADSSRTDAQAKGV